MPEFINFEFLENHPDPWVRYRTWLDLHGLPENDPRVAESRQEMVCHPLIQGLCGELNAWPGVVLSSHKSAGQLYHKLAFLAEVGLDVHDAAITGVLKKIAAQLSAEGLPQLPVNIPVHFGGDGQEKLAWALCDAPLLLWILLKTGFLEPAEATPALSYLLDLARPNGWPCTVASVLHFRGPGRKSDPCPYATLLMLKLLLDLPTGFQAAGLAREALDAGVNTLLDLWQHSLEQHPYQFYMGTDFRKLKVPFIWYDLMHVLDVLSKSESARQDERFNNMLHVLNSKAGPTGLFTPESEWKAWNGWEFGQKKQPSAWLTFLAWRINLWADPGFRSGKSWFA
jgi:hypothetical protein